MNKFLVLLTLLKKKIFILLGIVLLIIGIIISFQFFLSLQKPIIETARADSEYNVSGFAWSEHLGWISFNSNNCDTDDNGKSNGDLGCPPEGTTIANYGVRINFTNGNFSGYAWAGGGKDHEGNPMPTIGYIRFDPPSKDGYPIGDGFPNYSACLDLPNNSSEPCNGAKGEWNITGWARACSVFKSNCEGELNPDEELGGWDGWIKMAGTTQDNNPYGVWINETTNELHGWAWAGDDSNDTAIIGWISFNCAEGGASGGDICSTSTYNVSVSQLPPVVSNLTYSYDNACSQSRIPSFSWNVNISPPYDYQIQICKNSGCTDSKDPLINEVVENTVSTSWMPNSVTCRSCCNTEPYNKIEFGGVNYFTRVKAQKTGTNNWSGWAEISFTTKNNCYPFVNFNWSPLLPRIETPVQFCSVGAAEKCATPPSDGWSDCYASPCQWFWEFPLDWQFVAGSDAASTNPTGKFTSKGDKNVNLKITDSSGYNCQKSQPIKIQAPLRPKWKEVGP